MKFTHFLLCASIAVLAPSRGMAFDCNGALATVEQYTQKSVEIKQELSRLDERKNRAIDDYNRVDSDLENDLRQVDRDSEQKEIEFEQSIRERQLLGIDYDNTVQELNAGLYCSKCQRSKSEIERAGHEPFYKHLENVKGSSRSAPAELLRKAYENYKRDREWSLRRTEQIQKDMDRLEEKQATLRRDAERKKTDLMLLQNRLESEKMGLVLNRGNPLMSELGNLKLELKANNCSQ